LTDYFFDTSALIKRYLRETGSNWVRAIVRSPQNGVVLSSLATVEVHAVVARQQKGQRLTPLRANRIRTLYLAHLSVANGYTRIPVSEALLERASELAARYQLRALDSIHLASAIIGRAAMNIAFIFVTSDKELLAAAQAEKFPIDDPLLRP
jgi:uncharacterized protein